MTSQGMPPDAYTDAPALHPNLLIGSLQLLVWVFCHPLAWCHHVARVDRVHHEDRPTRDEGPAIGDVEAIVGAEREEPRRMPSGGGRGGRGDQAGGGARSHRCASLSGWCSGRR